MHLFAGKRDKQAVVIKLQSILNQQLVGHLHGIHADPYDVRDYLDDLFGSEFRQNEPGEDE